jgi:hypothetical protein
MPADMMGVDSYIYEGAIVKRDLKEIEECLDGKTI